jgi:hypothetical protein
MTSWDYKEWTWLVASAATRPGGQKLKGKIEVGKGRKGKQREYRKGKEGKGRGRK